MNEFKKNKVLKAPNLVSKEVCHLLARYALMKKETAPKIRRGNDPLANIHREYCVPIMDVLLDELTPKIEALTGMSLWPTLSFYYTYQKGNQLLPHKDRASCEVVVGLKIGSDVQYAKTKGDWPLYFNKEGKTLYEELNVGDAVIMNGHELEHWREPFEGEWFVSAIFGYVDKNSMHAYQKYDQRKQLGLPHIGIGKWYARMQWETLKHKWRQRKNMST
jgi:hypothetical protein